MPSIAPIWRASRSAMPRSSARCCELFAAQVPVYLQRLREAAASKAWKEATHTIKGSASAIGAWRLARFAEMAERIDVEATGRARGPPRRGRRRRRHGDRGGVPVHRAPATRPPEARRTTASGQGLNLRDRPANTPRGRNGPLSRRPARWPRPAVRSQHERSAQEACRPMAKITFIQPDGSEQVVDRRARHDRHGDGQEEPGRRHRGRVRRRLLVRHLPRLCRRGLAREGRRRPRRWRRTCSTSPSTCAPRAASPARSRSREALDGLVVAVPEKQF